MTDIKNDKINYQGLDFDNFEDFLCEPHDGNLLKGVYQYGFERPSVIQAKTILPIFDKRDMIAQAQSGSGKTGAFGIGVLGRINPMEKNAQAIIISNTRELAAQTNRVVGKIGEPMGAKTCICIGGSSSGKDVSENLNEAYESHILIGTPGRLVDLIERDDRRRSKGKLLDKLKLLVLDEADVLLGEDFSPQIQKIISKIPKDCQICLFSATYPPEVLELTKRFLVDPVEILVEREKISVDTIKNYYVNVQSEKNKYPVLVELYQQVSVCQAVIFVNSITKAIELTNTLKKDGHAVGILHAKLNDIERHETLQKFRLTQIRILVATDLLSRGIDVEQVGLVINYDIPTDEKYIHRVGRSGRFGKLGVAISFVTDDHSDVRRMRNIERRYSIRFDEMPALEDVNHYLTGLKGYNYIDTSGKLN